MNQKHSDYYYHYDRNDLNRPNPFKSVSKVFLNSKKKYTLNIPNKILKQLEWIESDTLEWIDLNNGSFKLRKKFKN